MVRTLTGHRSNCTSLEFHPFGEFFASGSADTDLKIWDIRKKGCIHTYKGHNLGINTIKFTPDGRWVVSGGYDNVVKVWDLTAGKLLHDFKFHDGHIRSLEFHPLEFLLATGSADRTVKFWDLETFEMIGSARAEATGVLAMAFHPDGRTLFSGYDNNLKVYSWEPVICHDTVDVGWSTLGDLTIHEGKALGCSYYRNSVGVWVADLARIAPYGASDAPVDSSPTELKVDLRERQSSEKVGSAVRSSSGLRATSPDVDSKEIKNIYVDFEKPVSAKKTASLSATKVASRSNSKENSRLSARKQNASSISTPAKSNAQARSFVVPSFVPRENSGSKSFSSSRRESLAPSTTPASGMSIKAAHMRRASSCKYEVGNGDVNSFDRFVADVGAKELVEDKNPTFKSVEEKSETNLSPAISSSNLLNVDDSSDSKETRKPKVINGVVVAHGRTRSLVEKFERRGKYSDLEDQTACTSPEVITDRIKSSTMLKEEPQVSGRESPSMSDANIIEDLMENHDALLSGLRSRLTKLQMVRHLWERNDIKGAINALKKLPDHSVQADVISVLLEKMEIVTMDLFSCMLPILVGLLDSKMERHVKMSLEMLLKLVAAFGPTIRSTISAPPAVGVDLHQEQRIESCKQCFGQLQQIPAVLPALARRGGSLAKSALELSLVLQNF